MKRIPKAFTLIELLIVVAIIAILAAIAVPNFLEAQTRSKVARVKADMRTLATAIEEYSTDWNRAPLAPRDWGGIGDLGTLSHLTTPVAYISSVPPDPFTELGGINKNEAIEFRPTFDYGHCLPLVTGEDGPPRYKSRRLGYMWYLSSNGPSRDKRNPLNPTGKNCQPMMIFMGANPLYTYDATNGTTSRGFVMRTNKGEYTGDDYKAQPWD